MGTRSLTFVYNDVSTEEFAQPVICMYRQFDGYPTGHGSDLDHFLYGRTIVNGFGMNTPPRASNGMGCLAASLVAHFKDGIGGFYLYPTDTNDAGQEYEYHIYEDKIVVKNYKDEILFDGSWDQYHQFIVEQYQLEENAA